MNVGILGGGQLGRMLALAGMPLGIRCRVLDPAADAPAGEIASLIVGAYDDEAALRRLASGADVVTWEFENVPAEAVERLCSQVVVRPSPMSLRVGQDRLEEKRCFARLGIATAPFRAVCSTLELGDAIASLGLPAVLKSRRMGYDGKGQRVLRTEADVAAAARDLGDSPLLLERLIAFDRELSVLAVRGGGETLCYPLVQNVHRDGILRLSLAPAPDVTPVLERRAAEVAAALLDELDYQGVLTIELFQTGSELLANELAPRVHNSGHWTIEGASTSQFENHLRAIVGWPLGAVTPVGVSAMINLIGAVPDIPALLAVPDAHLHLYAKSPRPRRKIGHITVRASDREALAARVSILAQRLGIDASL